MNFTDHMSLTDSTAIYPHAGAGTVPALAYVALGLAGESSEVLEKELSGDVPGVAAELGDTAWYLSRAMRELGLDPDEIVPADEDVEFGAGPALVVAAGRVAELTKKAVRDDAAELTETRRAALRDAIASVGRAWAGTVAYYLLDTEHVLAANAAKLTDRKSRGVLSGSGDHR